MTAHAPLRVLVCGGLLAVLAGCETRIDPACLEQDTALATQAFQACVMKPVTYRSVSQCAAAAERVACKRRAEK